MLVLHSLKVTPINRYNENTQAMKGPEAFIMDGHEERPELHAEYIKASRRPRVEPTNAPPKAYNFI
jgi:hypothetical protein